jgi:hypothetical protein
MDFDRPLATASWSLCRTLDRNRLMVWSHCPLVHASARSAPPLPLLLADGLVAHHGAAAALADRVIVLQPLHLRRRRPLVSVWLLGSFPTATTATPPARIPNGRRKRSRRPHVRAPSVAVASCRRRRRPSQNGVGESACASTASHSIHEYLGTLPRRTGAHTDSCRHAVHAMHGMHRHITWGGGGGGGGAGGRGHGRRRHCNTGRADTQPAR